VLNYGKPKKQKYLLRDRQPSTLRESKTIYHDSIIRSYLKNPYKNIRYQQPRSVSGKIT